MLLNERRRIGDKMERHKHLCWSGDLSENEINEITISPFLWGSKEARVVRVEPKRKAVSD